jgi:hypothetical protein
MNQLAKLIVDMTVGEAPPDPTLTKGQAAGRLSGIKEGATREKKSTLVRRKKV